MSSSTKWDQDTYCRRVGEEARTNGSDKRAHTIPWCARCTT